MWFDNLTNPAVIMAVLLIIGILEYFVWQSNREKIKRLEERIELLEVQLKEIKK